MDRINELKFQFKELDYGPFLEIRAEAPRVELHNWDGQGDVHPFFYAYCTAHLPLVAANITGDADQLAYDDFEMTSDTMILEQVVADNQVTRAIVNAIQGIEHLETGTTDRLAYLSSLVDILFNRLWD